MVPGPEMTSYTDVVAKIGQFDTDIKSYGDYPDKASYKNRAYSVSIEYGKTIELSEKSGTFVEPQLQFCLKIEEAVNIQQTVVITSMLVV